MTCFNYSIICLCLYVSIGRLIYLSVYHTFFCLWICLLTIYTYEYMYIYISLSLSLFPWPPMFLLWFSIATCVAHRQAILMPSSRWCEPHALSAGRAGPGGNRSVAGIMGRLGRIWVDSSNMWIWDDLRRLKYIVDTWFWIIYICIYLYINLRSHSPLGTQKNISTIQNE